jgi:hypothetical protein
MRINNFTRGKIKVEKTNLFKNIDLPNINDEVIIIDGASTKRGKRKVKGVVDSIYDRFIAVKVHSMGRIETFLKVDFLTEEVKYEKVC